MKGITHFMTGIAVATFFGKAVEMAATQKSWILVLGGAFGMLADTLDFKLYTFLSKEEYDIDPDPLHPDTDKMASIIGEAIEKAYDENRMIKIKCHTVRVGADLWRQYVIKFDPEKGEVVVIMNPIVSMSQVPYLGTEPKENRIGRYKLRVPLIETHGRPTVVDILSGPQIGFKRVGEAVQVEFIPFHRTWTHSFFVGFLCAAAAAVIASFAAGWEIGWYYGVVALAAFWAHLISDFSGYMGASFYWPFWKKRTRGLKWFKSQDPHSNFIFNYSCLMVAVWNVNRFTWVDNNIDKGHYIGAPWYTYFLYTIVIPIGIYLIMIKLFGQKESDKKESVLLAEEALAEMERLPGEV